jgi:hypothetical protein
MAAHNEQPPAALRNRLHALVAATPAADGAPVSGALLLSGQALLATILNSGTTQRDAALDLLAADALVTYAFEAAAEDPASLEMLAADAMRAISALVDSRTS